MTAKNERMRQHALILSMLPDLVLAVCRSGEMTYVSPACEWLLLHSPEEVMGANIFELVTQDCHDLLRKMISDNLSRPVQSLRDQPESSAPGDESGDRSDPALNPRGTVWRSPTQSSAGAAQGFAHRDKNPAENHRDRAQQRYRSAQAAPGAANSGKEVARHGNGRVAAPASKNPDMLRLIRCDKTTVWCESRLSVRKAKNDSSCPIPVEIILTLRTVSEGKKTSVSQGLPGALVPIHGRVGARDLMHGVDRMEDDSAEYVEDDDDGYRCEEDEDSNNSGSGNDSGARLDNSKGKGVERNVATKVTEDREEEGPKEGEGSGAMLSSRVEQTLSNKRKRVEDPESAEIAANNKSGEEDSSTGGDTAGSTTQEGSASCSVEADSNGEGSNSGSKWGDGCTARRGFNDESRCAEYGTSEDGSSDMSSAATDSGEEVLIQNAVQSLMRVRYSEEAAP